MARIHQILEIHSEKDGVMKPSGRFRHTVRSDEEGWVTGNCGCSGAYDNCPGHDTIEEAELAYRKGVIEKGIHRYTDGFEKRKCALCGEWTTGMATVFGELGFYRVCESHTNEEVEKFFITK